MDIRLAVMPAEEFRASLERLGITQRAAAIWMGVDKRSVGRWANGVQPVPPQIKLLLQLAESIKQLGRPVEGL